MFGKKSEPSQTSPQAGTERIVPVYTVHTLPRAYEVLCTVFSSKINNSVPVHLLQQLGRAGGAIAECDAVIGIMIAPSGLTGAVNAYGTAIRYV